MLAEERQEVADHRPGALRQGGKKVAGLRVLHAAALTILHAFAAQGLKEKYDYDKVLKALKKGACSAALLADIWNSPPKPARAGSDALLPAFCTHA